MEIAPFFKPNLMIVDRNVAFSGKTLKPRLQEEVNKETPQYFVGAFGPLNVRTTCHCASQESIYIGIILELWLMNSFRSSD